MSMTSTRRMMTLLGLALLALAASATAVAKVPTGEAKAKASNCFSCHAIDRKVVGPSFEDVAKRYAGQGEKTLKMLVHKVKVGGAGHWGKVPMAPHPTLSNADITTMVKWILSLKGAAAAATASAKPSRQYSYKNSDGKLVKADFEVFQPGTKFVTKKVFRGFELYNSYCFRCHGGDAVGGEYAPDLRHSLAGGMSFHTFLSTAMVGRAAKGMPSWAGFFEEKDIRAIYEYVKARQLDLIGVGRPPSSQD